MPLGYFRARQFLLNFDIFQNNSLLVLTPKSLCSQDHHPPEGYFFLAIPVLENPRFARMLKCPRP